MIVKYKSIGESSFFIYMQLEPFTKLLLVNKMMYLIAGKWTLIKGFFLPFLFSSTGYSKPLGSRLSVISAKRFKRINTTMPFDPFFSTE